MTFVSIGDCCVDAYPYKNVLGGTAFNSAVCAAEFNVGVSIVSAVGDDEKGKSYNEILNKKGINESHVKVSTKPTSTVHIALDENNSPVFGKWELGALQDWKLTKEDIEFIGVHNIAKMICLKPLEKQFKIFCQTPMENTLKTGDFNGNSQYSLKARELDQYVDGLDIVVKSMSITQTSKISFLQKLAKEKNKIILVTLGDKGSICFEGEKIHRQEAIKIETTNTTGFGDIFITVFLINYFKTKNIPQSLGEATRHVAGTSHD